MSGTNSTDLPREGGSDNSKTPVLIAALAVIGVLSVVVGIAIMVWLTLRRNRRKRGMNRSDVEVPLTSTPRKEPDLISEPDSVIFSEISLHRKDETYYATKMRFAVEEKMKEKCIAVVVGPAGSGKTTMGFDILSSLMNKKVKGKKCTCKVITRVGDWEDKISPKKNTVLLFDSCFERWNWMPGIISDDMSSLLSLHEEYLVPMRNVLVVFTFRSHTWNKFKSKITDNIDIKDDYIFDLLGFDAFTENEKNNILARHFQTNNIVCCEAIEEENFGSLDTLDKNKQAKMHTATFKDIINTSEQIPNTVGFPVVCATYCYNRRLLGKGKEYFLDPTDTLKKDVTTLMKSKQEADKQKFCTLVYAALNGGQVTVGKEDTKLYTEICKALKLKNGATQVLDIDDDYLMETGTNTFAFQHETVMRIVLFTFGEQFPEIFVRSCNANVLLRYIRTKRCDVVENEDVITVRKDDNYKILAQRFLEILDDPDSDDIRSHVCMSEEKFKALFAKRFSKEFEGEGKKKNPSISKVRSSVRSTFNRISWGQQTKL